LNVLKDYLKSFEDEEILMEFIPNKILNNLRDVLNPRKMKVSYVGKEEKTGS